MSENSIYALKLTEAGMSEVNAVKIMIADCIGAVSKTNTGLTFLLKRLERVVNKSLPRRQSTDMDSCQKRS